jgi:hypothetical protein
MFCIVTVTVPPVFAGVVAAGVLDDVAAGVLVAGAELDVEDAELELELELEPQAASASARIGKKTR